MVPETARRAERATRAGQMVKRRGRSLEQAQTAQQVRGSGVKRPSADTVLPLLCSSRLHALIARFGILRNPGVHQREGGSARGLGIARRYVRAWGCPGGPAGEL